jgi:hypothetical protein
MYRQPTQQVAAAALTPKKSDFVTTRTVNGTILFTPQNDRAAGYLSGLHQGALEFSQFNAEKVVARLQSEGYRVESKVSQDPNRFVPPEITRSIREDEAAAELLATQQELAASRQREADAQQRANAAYIMAWLGDRGILDSNYQQVVDTLIQNNLPISDEALEKTWAAIELAELGRYSTAQRLERLQARDKNNQRQATLQNNSRTAVAENSERRDAATATADKAAEKNAERMANSLIHTLSTGRTHTDRASSEAALQAKVDSLRAAGKSNVEICKILRAQPSQSSQSLKGGARF